LSLVHPAKPEKPVRDFLDWPRRVSRSYPYGKGHGPPEPPGRDSPQAQRRRPADKAPRQDTMANGSGAPCDAWGDSILPAQTEYEWATTIRRAPSGCTLVALASGRRSAGSAVSIPRCSRSLTRPSRRTRLPVEPLRPDGMRSARSQQKTAASIRDGSVNRTQTSIPPRLSATSRYEQTEHAHCDEHVSAAIMDLHGPPKARSVSESMPHERPTLGLTRGRSRRSS
jgi:hypothetical protein